MIFIRSFSVYSFWRNILFFTELPNYLNILKAINSGTNTTIKSYLYASHAKNKRSQIYNPHVEAEWYILALDLYLHYHICIFIIIAEVVLTIFTLWVEAHIYSPTYLLINNFIIKIMLYCINLWNIFWLNQD